jgi:hypothetical protein
MNTSSRRGPCTPSTRLDSERVVEAAAQMADAEGLDAVTLARVGGVLGVRPPPVASAEI